ncbi:hypothetical protein EIP91_006481 [Steccherinum ochraceum]|uniref:Uncharacterized protein n=1 Tax=Steccherinum ochraceum TaxID=92696 RepID=A0A4R0S135_9APHY|nr:hypothetical protein EIP91_006481 [Steccherinum ochraceum]
MDSWASLFSGGFRSLPLFLGSDAKSEPTSDTRPRRQPGTANLRFYLANAVPPSMQLRSDAPPVAPRGHKSHANNLTVKRRPWRSLKRMLDLENFNADVANWVSEHIPATPLDQPDIDPENGTRLTIPNEDLFTIPYTVLDYVGSVDGILEWCMTLPLRTVQRVLHLALGPEYARYRFREESGDVDHPIFGTCSWRRDDGTPSVMIMVQPPWILASADIKAVWRHSELASIVAVDSEGNETKPYYQSPERVWAKIYDTCMRARCRYFVLTNYEGWIIGHFAEGWTTAFSTLIQYDSTSPTLIEALSYWFAEAANPTRTVQVSDVLCNSPPEDMFPSTTCDFLDPVSRRMASTLAVVPELVEDIVKTNRYISPPPSDKHSDVPYSDSSWDDDSDVHSIMSVETIIGRCSPDPQLEDVPMHTPDLGQPDREQHEAATKVNAWQAASDTVVHERLMTYRHQSPADSVDSNDSEISMIQDHMNENKRRGSWVAARVGILSNPQAVWIEEDEDEDEDME